ncbi:MAG: 16S rRNA (adenine(1518)-N(6)/adenine(1519)-N(6))-dimethyltransferase RsmA [Candidatus Binatia bacterium]|nr:16S rRNA (adenine(1518)-N(6)/adenine(1519)-N(6))-dimethyltransferase RsmA [Candidatus Binatia bacterium]
MPLPTSPCERSGLRGQSRTAEPESARPPSTTLGGERIREALGALGRHPRKALGQHFLAQPAIAHRMAELAAVNGKHVVEIGPGLGVLTQFLLEARHLWLIEIDADFAARLQDLLREAGNVTVVASDALALDWRKFLAEHAPVTIVGNLPYNIATALLERWLDAPVLPERIVVMVQYEVAERLHARPRSKSYSALSVLTQAVARVRKGFTVAPGAFVPPPKVHSQVVVIEPDEALRPRAGDFATLRRIVRTLFYQRRKQLRNSLAQLTLEPESVLEQTGLDPRCRAEELAVEDFLRLAAALSHHAGAA